MKRGENEDFEAYKERREFMKKITKLYLKGICVWNSKEKGQYIKGLHTLERHT